MPYQRLKVALRTPASARCADGCAATRALFAPAIEREVRGEPPDADLYARLNRCPACAQEYSAALDLAFQLDREEVRAADVAPVALPLALRARRSGDEAGGLRRVAEDTPPYGDTDD